MSSVYRLPTSADYSRYGFKGLGDHPWFDPSEHTWKDEALCAQTDPEAFFPEKGGSTREAKKICGMCPVREACLDYALENDERFGIWGGHSERERRRIKIIRSGGRLTASLAEVHLTDYDEED